MEIFIRVTLFKVNFFSKFQDLKFHEKSKITYKYSPQN